MQNLTRTTRLQTGLFGLLLGCSGVPIYIHLPRFASVELGIGLALVGAILIGIRILDFAQDPILGWFIDRFPQASNALTMVSLLGLAVGFLLVFSAPLGGNAPLALTAGLVVLLTSYSIATILLYAAARRFQGTELRSVSVWRETGIVTGILLGSIAPLALSSVVGMETRYQSFGIFVAVLSVLVLILAGPLTRRIDGARTNRPEKLTLTAQIRRLVFLAFVNAMPVALTSTLFLFFVEDVLGRAALGGAFLAVFFLAAGVSIPVWNWISRHLGARDTLTVAMTLAIFSFFGAFFLTPEAANWFWIISIASGAAVGADMILLPVLFTSVLIAEKQPSGQAFGLWFLASKLSLAGAAVLALPILDLSGFVPGDANSTQALGTLVILYSAVPCGLKILSIVLIRTLPKKVYSS